LQTYISSNALGRHGQSWKRVKEKLHSCTADKLHSMDDCHAALVFGITDGDDRANTDRKTCQNMPRY
jgi:hypothetical protein